MRITNFLNANELRTLFEDKNMYEQVATASLSKYPHEWDAGSAREICDVEDVPSPPDSPRALLDWLSTRRIVAVFDRPSPLDLMWKCAECSDSMSPNDMRRWRLDGDENLHDSCTVHKWCVPEATWEVDSDTGSTTCVVCGGDVPKGSFVLEGVDGECVFGTTCPRVHCKVEYTLGNTAQVYEVCANDLPTVLLQRWDGLEVM